MAKSIEIDRKKRLREEPGKGHNRWHPDIAPVIEAAPGDLLEIEYLDIRPERYGWTRFAPGGGIESRSDGSRRQAAMKEFERITHDTQVMGGKPTIRGMRVTVGAIVGLIGAGHTVEEVLADYPYLEREDLLQALRYAAWRAEEKEVALPEA